jgi:hypothetical protein
MFGRDARTAVQRYRHRRADHPKGERGGCGVEGMGTATDQSCDTLPHGDVRKGRPEEEALPLSVRRTIPAAAVLVRRVVPGSCGARRFPHGTVFHHI